MKIRPDLLLLNNEEVYYKKILVTGTDEPLINHVLEFIIKKFKEKNFFIDTSGSVNKNLSGDIFSDNKILFVLKDFSTRKEGIEISETLEQHILISSSNSKKIGALKGEFHKSKEALLVECYPLTRSSKEVLVKKFSEKNKIKFSREVFMYILDNLDNNYVLLEKQLESLSLFKPEINNILDVEKAVFVGNKIEINKIFFQVFKKNNILINLFDKNINSQTDFYLFLSSIKTYLGIISGATSKEGALAIFPKYLFNEKDIFGKIYSCLNKERLKKIYKNILKVEILVRKNPTLYSVIGVRFLINTKKIITS